MYKSLPHSKLVQVCIAKSLSHKKPLQIHTYKYLPHSKLVQICSVQISLSHRKLVPMCANLSLTVSGYKYEQSLSQSKLVPVRTVQISLPPEAGTNVYKSLPHSRLVQECTVQISPSHRQLVPICANLSLRWLYLYS